MGTDYSDFRISEINKWIFIPLLELPTLELPPSETGEITMVFDVFVELEDQEKPVVIAEWITKAYVKPQAA